jgi:hypothetical protein
VQASNEPNPRNTIAPRTIDAIYLRPMTNKQGVHEVMDLATGRVITRMRVVEVPATDLVVEVVERMGEEQGFKSFKITNRKREIVF